MVVLTQGVIHDAAHGQPGIPGFERLDDTEMIRHGPERAVGFRHGPPPHGAHVQDKAVLVQPGVRLPRRRPGNPRLAGHRARQDGNVVLSS